MGYTQKLGLLAQSVFQDSSLNVGIGAAPSGTYKLEVTGTAKVSSTLLLGGALSGTSATFSGNLEVFSGSAGVTVGDFLVNPTTKYVYVGRQSSTSGDNTTFVVRDRTGSARATIPGGGSIDTVFSTNNSNFIVSNYSGTSLMTIANTGAATFSSSVTAVGLFSTTSASGTLAAKIRNGTTSASGATGYGLAIESEASAATSYALTVRNLAESTTYFLISTETGKVGNVGIGTSSPSYKLHISGGNGSQLLLDTTSQYCGIDIANTSSVKGGLSWDNTNATFGLYTNGSLPMTFQTNNTERMRITSEGYLGTTVTGTSVIDGDLLGLLSFVSRDSSTYSSGGITNIRSYATSTYNTGNVSGDLRFYVSNGLQNITANYLFGTEAMRITSAGYLNASNNGTYRNIGAAQHSFRNDANSNNVMDVTHSGTSPYGILVSYSAVDPNNTTNYILSGYSYSSSISLYTIWSNGTVSGRSDIRLKKNIEDATPKLDSLMKLRVVNYEWKQSINGSKEIGLIAQEVEEVFPNLVITEPIIKTREVEQEDGTILEEKYEDGDSKSIKHSVLPFMLLKAIQEQQAIITSLQDRLDKAGL